MEFVKVIEIRNRMCNKRPCVDCPVFAIEKGKGMNCMDVLTIFPAEFEKALIEWDKSNPVKTFLSDFLEKHPKVALHEVGTPFICPYELGYTTDKDCCFNADTDCADCLACWSRPLESEGAE